MWIGSPIQYGSEPASIDSDLLLACVGLAARLADQMTPDSLETRYSADADLRQPRQFARGLFGALVAARLPAGRLMVRDLRAQHRQSALGYLWMILPPIATTLAWVLLNNALFNDTATTETPYAIFVLVGTLLWQGLVDSLNAPLQKLSNSSGLVTKVNFPTEALYMAGFGEVTLNAVVRLLLLIPVFIWYGVTPTGWIVLAPVGVMSILVFGYAIGMLLTPIGMLYHDVPKAITVALTFWFLVTPVAYVSPEEGIGVAFQRLNPMAPLITTTRDWFTVGSANFTAFIAVSAAAGVLAVAGLVFCRVSMPHLVDRLST